MRQDNYPAGVDDAVIEGELGEAPVPPDATCGACRYCAMLDRGADGPRAWVCVRDVVLNGPRDADVATVDECGSPLDVWCEDWEAA